MAHADYHCCAVCDTKMDYASGGFAGARTKEDICTRCLKRLHQAEVMVYDGDDFRQWIEGNSPEHVASVCISVGYRMCHYDNPIDDAFCEKTGIDRERGKSLAGGMIESSDVIETQMVSEQVREQM